MVEMKEINYAEWKGRVYYGLEEGERYVVRVIGRGDMSNSFVCEILWDEMSYWDGEEGEILLEELLSGEELRLGEEWDVGGELVCVTGMGERVKLDVGEMEWEEFFMGRYVRMSGYSAGYLEGCSGLKWL